MSPITRVPAAWSTAMTSPERTPVAGSAGLGAGRIRRARQRTEPARLFPGVVIGPSSWRRRPSVRSRPPAPACPSCVRPVAEGDQAIEGSAEIGDLSTPPAGLRLLEPPGQLAVGEDIEHPAREVPAPGVMGEHALVDHRHDAAEVVEALRLPHHVVGDAAKDETLGKGHPRIHVLPEMSDMRG